MPKVGEGVYPGQQVLENMGFAKSTIGNTIKAQGLIILANYIFTCWSLIRQNPAEQEPIGRVESQGGGGEVVAVWAPEGGDREGDGISSGSGSGERKVSTTVFTLPLVK